MQLAMDSASRSAGRGGASVSPDRSTAASACVERVGPNTLIQTLAAVRERLGAGWAAHVTARADLPEPLPRDMVDERLFARLITVLVSDLGAERADDLLAQGGVGTGVYVLENRIPRPVRGLLRLLPAPIALRLLFRAVRAHAWTFAGSARFEHRFLPGGAEFTLSPSLVCATAAAARPMGSYYARAVEILVRALVSPAARVVEDACVATGAPCCRFRVILAPPSPHAPSDDPPEDPCASS